MAVEGLLWLGCYNDGAYRPRCTGQFKKLGQLKRAQRQGLPDTPWLQARLKKELGEDAAVNCTYGLRRHRQQVPMQASSKAPIVWIDFPYVLHTKNNNK